MQEWLSARVKASPDKVFLKTPEQQWTFREIYNDVLICAAQLRKQGVQQGDNIAFVATNQQPIVVLIFALMRLGAVLVPINARLTADEVDFQLGNSDAKLFIAERDYLEHQPFGVKTLNLDRLLQGGEADETEVTEMDSPLDLTKPFAIVHTSGTSGTPKGAVLTYGNIFYGAMSSAYRSGVLPDDCWLCVLPLYHVGGLSIIMRSVLYGTRVDLLPKFDLETVQRKLSDEPVTLVSLVPTMLYRLLESKTQPWNPHLRLVLLGGAAPSPELVQQCLAENIPVSTTYGLTEAASQVATATPEQVVAKPGTVGKPLIFTQVRIVNDDEQDVVIGEIGEVLVSGPTVMHGYHNNPEANAKTLRDGWLHTGDIGYLDKDGDLWIVQRRSDLIITGGENVYPAEIEAVLRQHPSVREAVIIGLEDPEWGQRVAAVIQLRDGQTISEESLIQFMRQNLAGYKQPRLLRIVSDLPQTGSGKINRAALKALFE